MTSSRRQFLRFATGVAAPALLSGPAWAQTYPARPVRIMVGFAAGGPNDILARLLGEWWSERLGQQFIVENRPGAGSNLATEAVVRAPPDGYTLLLVGSPNAINATLYENLDFNFLRDIAPVAGLTRGALVMVIHPSVPAHTIPEFIAYAKANPGKLSYGSGGVGGITHIAAELFKQAAGGLDLQHVPYRGVAPAITDLLGGQVQVVFVNLAPSIGYIASGRLRALGLTTAKRSEALPDVPVIGEFVPGYEASSVFGIGAPKDTPAPTIDKLNMEANAALADPGFRMRLRALDATELGGSPVDFGKLMAAETEKWARVISLAKIRPE
ncbi:Bug family tripartite tricarboxylate transporter substrate binding protein [Bradyrhizobium guangzhouense]|uniref:Tripartite tricarboxylate transporter substrate binding protein n=1 Tax=Bradyrhizobium guangzhouense TaxID=1325095 RepID=A0AAE5X4R1_9BRAD|nr:tripartite tricarboxylate transporter substrate binding protein [Bradyrhizobium guangzhouense]RXH09625.1 tripartite tricarboxylate transporter substrate binding protein [Bradyrhizobium guangzhouense]